MGGEYQQKKTAYMSNSQLSRWYLKQVVGTGKRYPPNSNRRKKNKSGATMWVKTPQAIESQHRSSWAYKQFSIF